MHTESSRRKFWSYDPLTQSLPQRDEGRTWEYRILKWWDKVRGQCGHPDSGFSFEDHTGFITGSDIVSTNPYHLSPTQAVELLQLEERFDLKVDISGISPWYPGRTVGIELTPSERTYQILKLKPPANAQFRKDAEYKKAHPEIKWGRGPLETH